MKTIKISQNQFIRLNESLSNVGVDDLPIIDVTADSVADVPKAGEEAAGKIASTGARAAKIRVRTGGASIDNSLELSGNDGDTIQDQLTDATKDAQTSGIDSGDVSYTSVIDNTGAPVLSNEGKKYSKRKIEESRVIELKKNGKTFTKKELNEILSKK